MSFIPSFSYNENSHKIDWFWLSTNPNAISILEKNLDKIDWARVII